MELNTEPKGNQSHPLIKKLIILLTFLLLLSGGMYGVYYWQNSKVSQLNAKVADLQSQTTALTKSNETLLKENAELKKQTDTDRSAKKITIEEWNIEMPNNSSNTLSYRILSGGNSLEFISTDLPVSSAENCDESLGLELKRFKGKPTGDPRFGDADPVVIIDGYYYYTIGAPGACGELAAKRLEEVNDALEYLVATR